MNIRSFSLNPTDNVIQYTYSTKDSVALCNDTIDLDEFRVWAKATRKFKVTPVRKYYSEALDEDFENQEDLGQNMHSFYSYMINGCVATDLQEFIHCKSRMATEAAIPAISKPQF